MSASKPVRILKTFASRTSLRGHGRRTSASSVNSVGSQLDLGAGEPEHGREVSEEDYGKEVVKSADVLPESVPVAEPETMEEAKGDDAQSKSNVSGEGEDKQATVPAGSEHEAEVRQEQSQPEQAMAQTEQDQKQEPEAPIEQTGVDSEEAAAPVVEAVVEPVMDDVKHAEHVAADAEQTVSEAAGPDSREERETHVDATSLSSSSTNVDLAIPPTDTDADTDADGFVQVKQTKMEQDPAADINPFLVDDPEDPLSEPEAEREAAPLPGAETPVVQSLVLSAQLENVDTATPPTPPASVPAPVVDESAPAPSPPEKPLPAPSEGTTSSASSSAEDDAPELHTPALTVTSLFLPVPHVRTFVHGFASLTWWLTAKAASYPLYYWPGLASSRISPLSYLSRPTR